MAEKDFAIVCDSSCDLPTSFFEKAKVECVTLSAGVGDEQDLVSELAALYRDLAARGYARIASVHSAACFSPALEAARAAAASCGEATVEVIDSGSGSCATGMLIDRIARHRYFGLSFEDSVEAIRTLASHVRLLVVPTASARLGKRRPQRSRLAVLARATASLRVRISGERGLYLLSRGEITQLARATELIELTSRLAHAISAVSAGEGAVVYALTETGDARALHAAEKPLNTNEFESRCLGTVRASAHVESLIGHGAVAVAFAPAASYDSGGGGSLMSRSATRHEGEIS